MKILQIREYLSYGDGIGNTIMAMDRVISERYDTVIAVRQCSDEYESLARLVRFNTLDELDVQGDDIVIYHFGEWCSLLREFLDIKCKKVLMYQNVTFPHFYAGINDDISLNCSKAQKYVRNSASCFLKALTPSLFSQNELINMGWNSEDVYLLPLPVSLEKKNVTEKKKNEERTFLFVGRMVPNKKIEDVIRVFDFYRRNYYKNSYLKLVGDNSKDIYYRSLCKYIEKNNIKNVEFTGRVTDEKLEEMYRTSDIYLCMSEHEGFCIPLIEAMSYGIPVVAYNSTAVPDTMGDAGILLEKKDNKYVCERIDKLFNDLDYSLQLIEGQYRHLEKYIRNDCQDRLYSIIDEINSIESYEYDNDSWEFYRILLEEIDRNSKQGLLEQFKRISKKAPNIVIYGAGKVGTELIKLATELNVKFSAICDAGQYGKDLQGYTILSPQNCISQCKGAIYIITIQDKSIASQVADDLETMGVSKNNILYYSNTDKRIYI